MGDSEVKKQRPDLYTEDELVELIREAEERGDDAEAERWQDKFASLNNQKYERIDMADDERESQVNDGPPKAAKVDYKGNSNKAKEAEKTETAKPKVQKVVHGNVSERKPGLGSRIKETFLGGESIQTVLENVVVDVVVPQVKDLMFDFVSTTIQRKLFGTSRPIRSGGSTSNVPRVNYGGFSRGGVTSPTGRAGEADGPRPAQRAGQAYENLVFDNRGDAEAVIDALAAAIEQFSVVSLSDLYEMVGHTGKYTDEKYGWDTMVGAHVGRIREGFLLELPRPKFLD